MKRTRRSELMGGPLLAAMILPGVAAAQPVDQAAVQDGGLADIVVTAQKRAQSLQDVPISITALTAERLAANRVQNVLDLNAVTPNLTARPSAGGTNLPALNMRGITSIGAVPGSERQIATYIDGVYVGAAAGSVYDLADIERIEVLRGPQGTLFGQNATAGAISIITPDPKAEFGLIQEVTAGNYSQFRSRTTLNIPVGDILGLRVTYLHSERDGDMRNLGAGTILDYSAVTGSGLGVRRSPRRLGDQNSETIQVNAKLDVSDAIALRYKFFWNDVNATPEGVGIGAINPAFQSGLITSLFTNNPNPQNLTPIQSSRPNAVNNWFTTPSEFRNSGHAVSLEWEASDNLTVKNLFGYQRSSYANGGNQLDGAGGLLNANPAAGAVGAPFLLLVNIAEGRAKQWSNELQLNYDTSLLDVTAGYLHFKSDIAQGAYPGLANIYSFRSVPGFVFTPSATAPAKPTNINKSDAIYGQAELHVLPDVDLIAGGRYTWDRKSGTAQFVGLPNSFVYKKSKPSYTFGANYRPTDGVMLYGKYSVAYTAGGSSGGFSWEPEDVTSWEAGVKSDLFDRRLRLNLALFTTKYKGLQSSVAGQLLAASLNRPELVALGTVVDNLGDYRAKGLELEVNALPVEGLDIGGGLGYTDAKYTRISTVYPAGTQFKPNYLSKWTANVNVGYETQPLFNNVVAKLRIDANYRSSFLFAANRTLVPVIAAAGTVSPGWIVNGRAALAGFSVGGGQAEIAAWARNLTDNKSPTYSPSTTFILPLTYERARTYGVDVRFEF